MTLCYSQKKKVQLAQHTKGDERITDLQEVFLTINQFAYEKNLSIHIVACCFIIMVTSSPYSL
jgi:hypothetical protein